MDAPLRKGVLHQDQIEAGFQPYLANAKQNDGDWLTPAWITNLALTGGFLYESSVHLLDMLDVGLIDASWRDRLPPELAERLQALIDNPEG